MISRLLSLPIKKDSTSILAVDVLRDHAEKKLFFVADGDIDCDGSGGNPDGDRYFQPHTSYRLNGASLNAYKVPFIVVPVIIARSVPEKVLGCAARVTNLKTGQQVACIVGDIGPMFKLGELSVAAARRCGVDGNPVHGGVDDYNGLLYEIWPGVETSIDGIRYPLLALSGLA